jgi:hypothetical protein
MCIQLKLIQCIMALFQTINNECPTRTEMLQLNTQNYLGFETLSIIWYSKNYNLTLFKVSLQKREMWTEGAIHSSPNDNYPKIFSRMKGYVRFKPAGQYVQRYCSVVNCALNMEHPILNNFCKFSKYYEVF